METPDFESIFQLLPECYLILHADAPSFTIAAVSDAYLYATHTHRETIIGKGLFEVFPDNPDDQTADGVSNLRASLQRVLSTKKIDFMPIQKYDIKRSQESGAGFEERYWIPNNSPVLDASGVVKYIVHHVSDATEPEQLIRRFGSVESTHDLTGALSQMERLNEIMVDRELRMAELKKELAQCRLQGSIPLS